MAQAVNMPGEHPSKDNLISFANGSLPPAAHTEVEQHIASCEACIKTLENAEIDTLGDRLLNIDTRADLGLEGSHSRFVHDDMPAELAEHSRYHVLNKIGSGGMGEVYRAQHRMMDRIVAIKVMRRELFEDERANARFQNEIRATAKLIHPNIVHSYDAEEINGLNLLVMEHVAGRRLSDLVSKERPLPVRTACRIALQVATALDFANRKGFIHRDIKPQNILITRGAKAKILDFGLAKFSIATADDRESLTKEGEAFGSPDYVAPEQIRDSSSVDHRADIYGLGCTLYFMLTGRAPFAEKTGYEKLAGHLEQKPEDIQSYRTDLPLPMVELVNRMMAKDPQARISSYSKIGRKLESIRDSESTPTADPVELVEPIPLAIPAIEQVENVPPFPVQQAARPKPKKRRTANWSPLIWGGGGAAVILLLIVGYALVSSLIPGDDERQGNPSGGGGHIQTDTRTILVVCPIDNAWFPEINGLQQAAANVKDVRLEYTSSQTGIVTCTEFDGSTFELSERISKTLNQCNPDDYAAVVFVGAWDVEGHHMDDHEFVWNTQFNNQARVFVKQMLAANKPVGSVCGGTGVLAQAGILDKKNAADCRFLEEDIRENDKIKWMHQPLVVDGNLITGDQWESTDEVFDEIYRRISKK